MFRKLYLIHLRKFVWRHWNFSKDPNLVSMGTVENIVKWIYTGSDELGKFQERIDRLEYQFHKLQQLDASLKNLEMLKEEELHATESH